MHAPLGSSPKRNLTFRQQGNVVCLETFLPPLPVQVKVIGGYTMTSNNEARFIENQSSKDQNNQDQGSKYHGGGGQGDKRAKLARYLAEFAKLGTKIPLQSDDEREKLDLCLAELADLGFKIEIQAERFQ